MTVMKWMFWIVPMLELVGRAHGQQTVQIQVQPQVVGHSIRDGQVTTVFLAPRYVTAIRMPEPINSVVVGDPASFSAEHSDREPSLVFVKPITTKAAQTNLLISTTRGLQASVLLVSRGETKEEGQPAVDFLMRYKPAGQFMIQPADSPSTMIPQTITVGSTATVSSASGLSAPVVPASLTARGVSRARLASLPTAAANSKKLDRTAIACPLRPEARYLATGEGTGQDRSQRSNRSRQRGGGFVFSHERARPCGRVDAPAGSTGWHEEKREDRSQVTLVDG